MPEVAYVAGRDMSFIIDLLQSRQKSSKELLLDIWPVALQPTGRDSKQGYEQCTALGASASSSRADDAVRGDSHTISSCSGEGTGSQPQAQFTNNDLGTSELAKRPSPAQRKLQSNRQAQKRFRERQKVCDAVLPCMLVLQRLLTAEAILVAGKVAYCGSKVARNYSSA